MAVVRGTLQDYYDAHPTTASLVVEVSDTTLVTDRVTKARIYAAAGIADYWIANLVDGVLEVHRDPRNLPSGAVYASIARLDKSATVAPLGAPASRIVVCELLNLK